MSRLSENLFALFGKVIGDTPQNPNRMRFTGHERDLNSLNNDSDDFDYMHARYYNPNVARFLSVDPVRGRAKQPQSWNLYAYVRGNPLIFTDPTGETVYVVTYTTGNSSGDDDFHRAALTRAAEIRKQKEFDATKDIVLVSGVQTKADFAGVLKQANGLEATYGKVGQINLFSHAGAGQGPVFHDANGNATQFTRQELGGLQVNWGSGASARFFGCNTGENFSQSFASAQQVTAFGQPGYAYFSGSPAERIAIAPRGPVYLISAPGLHNPGFLGIGLVEYLTGNAYADPMVQSNP